MYKTTSLIAGLPVLAALALLSTPAFALEYGEWLIAIEYGGTNHGFADGERLQIEGAGMPGEALTQVEGFDAELGGGRFVEGQVDGGVSLTLSEEMFSLEVAVSVLTTCNDAGIGTCARSLIQDGELELFFTAPEDAELRFTGSWAGGDGEGVSLVDFFSLELVRLTGNPFNPQELIVVNTNQGDEGIETGTIDEIVQLEAGETYQLNIRNQTESGDGPDLGSAVFSGTIVSAVAPIESSVEDVSLITVLCRNLANGQSVTAALLDDTSWNCTDAALIAEAGDRILQIVVGAASCDSDTCAVGGVTTGVDGLVTVCRNLSSGAFGNAAVVEGAWSCPLDISNGDLTLQIVVGDAPDPGAAPGFH
ncbi:MAG: hypothetical protein AAF184_24155 [Pseudomonadota bacterium]